MADEPRQTNVLDYAPEADIDAVRQAHEHTALGTELLISTLLWYGVTISLIIVIAGALLTFARHLDYATSTAALPGLLELGAVFPHTLAEVLRGALALQGPAIVVLGLIVLMATPIVVVATCVVAFIYHRDRVFVAISIIVLIILFLSFVRR